MVEVFKTSVPDKGEADRLLGYLHENFDHFKANFDLEDCDNILRIESNSGIIEPSIIIDILERFGYKAEILFD